MSLQLQVAHLAKAGVGLKLQLGCGANILSDWINTDSTPSSPHVDYLDIQRPLPFTAAVLDAVFCEHTIEHVAKADGIRLVSEIFRVLKPGGLVRLVTPSLDALCGMAIAPQSDVAQKYLAFFRRYINDANATISDAINLGFYGHGHRHIYLVAELSGILSKAGFVNILAMTAEVYGNPLFNGVDGHGKVIGRDINAIEAMAIEAAKPPQ
jgi:predicted SAM-dependent methyltransferase